MVDDLSQNRGDPGAATALDEPPPLPQPFALRAPTADQLRRRTTQTLHVARRRLGALAAKRATRRDITPMEVATPLRKAFADLGVTYVKLGQLVASSPSVFGEDVSTEFRSLLDQGRPVSFDRVRRQIEQATAQPLRAVFSEIDPDPIGMASMAVVHRAELRTGEQVAVKILRPGIERKIAADFALMGWLIPRIASRIEGAQAAMVPPMLAGLREQLCEELDLRNEARVMAHFNRLLEAVELPSVVIPRPYDQHSSRRVLVMEHLDGVAIDDLATIETFGIDPTPLVNDIVKSFFLTALRFGVFHGDVHAGNLLLLRDGRIGVLDWGIVGRLDEDNRQHFRAIIRAALGDEAAWQEVTDRIIEQIGPLITHRLGISDDQVAPMIRAVLEPMFTRPFGEVQLSTLLLGPEQMTGGGADFTTRAGASDELPPGLDPAAFDRSMLLLTKQLLYFERYGQLYLKETSLLDDRAFFEALIAESPRPAGPPPVTVRTRHGCQDGAMTAAADPASNKALVQQFWVALYARDWDAIGSFFGPTSEYTDVPSPADDTAVGPAQIVARLRLGIEPITSYDHELRLMVAEGDAVVTEHAETWRWKTGEEVTLPFVSVQEVHDGVITRWWDYWSLDTLLGAAPQWWIEHIMMGWK